jgi:hypothetical protein
MARRRTQPAASGDVEIRTSDGGPTRWLLPFLEARYLRLEPKHSEDPGEQEEHELAGVAREEAAIGNLATGDRPGPLVPQVPKQVFRSVLQPGRELDALAELPSTYWHDLTAQYRARQVESRRDSGARFAARIEFEHGPAGAPGIAGTSNWVPIGPSVVRRGQPSGRPAISGRASGIAISSTGTRVYVATADGGVWRSDDVGASWYSTMDNFDLDPTTFAVTSLACGAIAIDLADPNRVYVGTGEGDTNALFASRLTNALPSYRGVGPLRSDDGGAAWHVEPTATGSPALAGGAFYALAVDPGDRENVVAATNLGLYRREPDGGGGYHWVQKRTGIHSSVVVARSGTTTTFFAAAWGDKVYSSADGSTWTAAGTSFPSGSGRIGLAVQPTSAAVLYALTANPSGGVLGLYRLDGGTGAWKAVSGTPTVLFGPSSAYWQGSYDLTITVDPSDPATVFMGGSFAGPANDASIYKGQVSASGSAYSISATYVGTGAHPDVHVVSYAPGDSSTVWVCCDGGVFKTTNATGAATFTAFNTGLATMSANYLAQHPTQAAVVFCGFQDNGSGRYTGEECWTSVGEGDGGYPVVNWNDPFKVLIYWNGQVFRATDGAQDYSSLTPVTPTDAAWYIMAQPLVTTPYSPGTSAEAETVAYGAGPALYVSTDFGTTWSTLPAPSGGYVYAMVFASASRLFVGTTTGRVYRYDKSGAAWTQTRLDNAAGGALPLTGLLTDVQVDPSDATLQSIYISFGGNGDYRHVWHFDGTKWQARSGPSAGATTSLLDVEHNALAIDPTTATPTLYAAADIGVWKSTDGGFTWAAFENGLPDAAVLDLQLHSASRRLRAALHGRGVYEYKLDAPIPPDVEVYMRDTNLDVGLVATVDGFDDPAQPPHQPVHHWESPNIKVDVPTSAGWQTSSPSIDFYQFNDKITDGSGGVAALDPTVGTVTNRVYVEVHNRGIAVAPTVQVMLLMTDASVSLTLPAGYTTNVVNGTPITSPPWRTVGIKKVSNLRVGAPQVVEFNLPSTMLPPPSSLPGDSHYCLVAILHAPGADVFASTTTSVDALTVADRKVAQKNIHIVQFVGTPPGAASVGYWTRIMIGSIGRLKPPLVLELDLRAFPGQLGLLAPRGLFTKPALERYPSGATIVEKWAAEQEANLARVVKHGRFDRVRCAQMARELELVKGQPLLLVQGGTDARFRLDLEVAKGATLPLYVRIQPPPNARAGATYTLRTALLGAGRELRGGGGTYRIEFVPPRKQ